MSIYRYQKINENNLAAWANDELWFSAIDNLDDGFEMWWKPNTTGFEDGLKENIDDYLEEYRKNLIKKSAYCCFSMVGDIPLMWALYGNGLRGVCIEYEENKLILNEKMINATDDIWSVTYSRTDALISPDIAICHKEQNFQTAEKALVATKSSDWKYQQEVRLIWRQEQEISKGVLVGVNRESVKAVIFGERSEPDKIKLVKDIFGPEMKYKIAKRSKTHYKIEIVDHPSP